MLLLPGLLVEQNAVKYALIQLYYLIPDSHGTLLCYLDYIMQCIGLLAVEQNPVSRVLVLK